MIPTLKPVTIYGKEHLPQVGSYIVKDGKRVGERLLAGDATVDAGYPGSQFRIPTGDCLIPTLPVNVEITGRTLQRVNGSYAVRVRLEYVGDCEASTFCSGWMYV